jgi:hypothetical protein
MSNFTYSLPYYQQYSGQESKAAANNLDMASKYGSYSIYKSNGGMQNSEGEQNFMNAMQNDGLTYLNRCTIDYVFGLVSKEFFENN